MRASGPYETRGRNESEGELVSPRSDRSLRGARKTAPSRRHRLGAEEEYTRWDPKDGELCLSRAKPEETLVEVRSDSDVQIDRQTWV